eukprot:363747-Chlamydomonas_euryale.AAC.17
MQNLINWLESKQRSVADVSSRPAQLSDRFQQSSPSWAPPRGALPAGFHPAVPSHCGYAPRRPLSRAPPASHVTAPRHWPASCFSEARPAMHKHEGRNAPGSQTTWRAGGTRPPRSHSRSTRSSTAGVGSTRHSPKGQRQRHPQARAGRGAGVAAAAAAAAAGRAARRRPHAEAAPHARWVRAASPAAATGHPTRRSPRQHATPRWHAARFGPRHQLPPRWFPARFDLGHLLRPRWSPARFDLGSPSWPHPHHATHCSWAWSLPRIQPAHPSAPLQRAGRVGCLAAQGAAQACATGRLLGSSHAFSPCLKTRQAAAAAAAGAGGAGAGAAADAAGAAAASVPAAWAEPGMACRWPPHLYRPQADPGPGGAPHGCCAQPRR